MVRRWEEGRSKKRVQYNRKVKGDKETSKKIEESTDKTRVETEQRDNNTEEIE